MQEITHLLQTGPCHDDNEVMLKTLGRDIFLSFYQSGVSARIRANSAGNREYYFDLFVKVPRTLGLRTSGFLGSPDGDITNDLFERKQNDPLPPYYGDRQLYSHLITCKTHESSLNKDFSMHYCLQMYRIQSYKCFCIL